MDSIEFLKLQDGDYITPYSYGLRGFYMGYRYRVMGAKSQHRYVFDNNGKRRYLADDRFYRSFILTEQSDPYITPEYTEPKVRFIRV